MVGVLRQKKIKASTELFQFLRLLEAQSKNERIKNKKITLTCSDSMSFPSSDFLIMDETNDSLTLELNFMGLFGVDGCLPNFFNDVLHAESESSQRIKDFLNIFHHQINTLFYKAWKSQRPDISLELGSNVWLSFLAKLVPRMDVESDPLELGEHLIGHRRTLTSLHKMLSLLFSAYAISIHTLQPSWCFLNSDNYLGQFEMILGDNVILGEQYLAASQALNIQFGPMTITEFSQLKKSKEYIMNLVHRYIDIFPHVTLSALVLHLPSRIRLGIETLPLGQGMPLGEQQQQVNHRF